MQNEFKEFYKLGFGEAKGKCKDLEKFSHLWYYNKCDKQRKITANYDVNTYNGRSEIPEKGSKPNYETLLYYYWNYTNGNWFNKAKYSVIKASENPYEFKFQQYLIKGFNNVFTLNMYLCQNNLQYFLHLFISYGLTPRNKQSIEVLPRVKRSVASGEIPFGLLYHLIHK